MAQSAEQTPAGEVRNVILVNLPHFFAQIETTTQKLNDCVAEHGTIYTDAEDSDNLYVELTSPTVLILQDLQNRLESQLRTVTMYAAIVPMNENYNFITVKAAEAITMAKIYLGHADLQHDPNPNDQMDIDDTGDHTSLEAVTSNDPDTQEQAKSTEANENSPHMQMTNELNVLQINIDEEEVDLLCPEGENPSELSLTTAPRDGADPLHREPMNPAPVDDAIDDDIVMMTTPQDKSDTKSEDDVNLKTIRCDPEGHEEAHTQDDPKTTATKQSGLTSCQIYRQNESAEQMKKKASQLADQVHSPTEDKATGTPTIPPPTPVPPKRISGPPKSSAKSEDDPTIPATK